MEDLYVRMMANSVKVESQAVSFLNLALSKCPLIQPEIRTNDKTPSWDGDIYIYDSTNCKKDDFRYRLPVQVKGTSTLPKSRIKTYSIDVSDLRNYYRDGGCIFFRVYVDELHVEKSKIYYASLTPFELRQILEEVSDQPNQKKLSIKLKEFPKDNADEIFNICAEIASNCDKQHSFINPQTARIPSLIEVLKAPDALGIEKFSMSWIMKGVDSSDIDRHITTHDIFMYAKLKNLDILMPIGPVQISGVSGIIEGQVTVGQNVYYESFVRNTEQGRRFIQIGKAVTMTSTDDQTSPKIQFTPRGYLEDFIKDTTFFIDLLEAKSFRIGEFEIPIIVQEKGDIPRLKADLDYYKKINLMLKQLGVKRSLNLESASQNDWRNIRNFVIGVLYNKGIFFSKNRKNVQISYGLFRLGNLNIMLWFEGRKNGSFTVRNFFDKAYSPKIESYAPDGELVTVSRYVLLNKQCLLEAANLDLQAITDEICHLTPTPLFVSRVQLLMLEVLKAYDEQPAESEVFLEVADKLCKFVDEADMIAYKETQILNRFQIKRRQTCLLSNDDVRELANLTDSSYPWEIRCGASLLLGHTDEAQEYFNQMDIKKQNEFLTYPICRFGNLTQKHEVSDSRIVK